LPIIFKIFCPNSTQHWAKYCMLILTVTEWNVVWYCRVSSQVSNTDSTSNTGMFHLWLYLLYSLLYFSVFCFYVTQLLVSFHALSSKCLSGYQAALQSLIAVNAAYGDDHGGRASPYLCYMNYMTAFTARIINKFLSLVHIQGRGQRGGDKGECSRQVWKKALKCASNLVILTEKLLFFSLWRVNTRPRHLSNEGEIPGHTPAKSFHHLTTSKWPPHHSWFL